MLTTSGGIVDALYRTILHFNTIYVLESLAPGELRTGRELYESVIVPATQGIAGLHAEYHEVLTQADLQRTLAMIHNDCSKFNRGPIIHLETHGDIDGLALADGTLLPWRDVTPQLTDINRASRMNLLVLAMMCRGWDLTKALMPSERAPVFMLIGPPETLSAGDIQDATERFYAKLLTAWDSNSALIAMNDDRPFEEWPIRPATAEILFCRVFRLYIQELAAGTNLQDRENKLVADIARTRQLTVIETAGLRADIRENLTDPAWQYAYLRHQFLMLDLFPEGSSRFGLTYEKCVGEVAQPTLRPPARVA